MICVVCDSQMPPTRGRTQPHCNTDACNEGYARYMALEGPIEKVGDCDIWRGRVTPQGGVPMFTVVLDRSTRNGIRRDYRVLDLRRELAGMPVASYRQYQTTCGNRLCVNVEHSKIRPLTWRKPEKHRELQGHLDAAPLLRLIDRCDRTAPKKLQESIQKGRQRGFFTVGKVDEICIDYLCVHPIEVYGEEFFVA